MPFKGWLKAKTESTLRRSGGMDAVTPTVKIAQRLIDSGIAKNIPSIPEWKELHGETSGNTKDGIDNVLSN